MQLLFALTLAVVAISTAAVLFRLAPDVPPLTAAGDRLVLAGLVLLAVVGPRRVARVPRGRGLGAGLAYAVHFGAWVASLGLTSVAASVTAVTTSPILLAAWGLATRRDAPSARTLAALALAVVGVAWLATTSGAERPAHLLGLALGLLGAVAIAVYFLLARRGGPTLDALAFSCVATLSGGVALLVTAAALGEPLVPGSAADAWLVVGAAALPQLVGHTLMTWALRQATPTTVALATLGEPAGASFLAALVLHEPLSTAAALACLVTLVGVAIAASRPDGGASTSAEDPATLPP
ncbi:MAG: DMT family transporter [Myxococcota bacterium]